MIETIKHYWRVWRRKSWIEYHADDDLQLINVYDKGKVVEGNIWWILQEGKKKKPSMIKNEINQYIDKMSKKYGITRILGTVEVALPERAPNKKDSKKVREAKKVVYRKPRV